MQQINIQPEVLNFAFTEGSALPEFTIHFKDFAGNDISTLQPLLHVLNKRREDVKLFDTDNGLSVAGPVLTLKLESDLTAAKYFHYLELILPGINNPIRSHNGSFLIVKPFKSIAGSTDERDFVCKLPVELIAESGDYRIKNTDGSFILNTDDSNIQNTQ